jgi:hypothetical protein
MQRWEYQTITLKREYKTNIITGASVTNWNSTINLQQLGEEGWELVSVVPIADFQSDYSGFTHQLQYIFKRPKG